MSRYYLSIIKHIPQKVNVFILKRFINMPPKRMKRVNTNSKEEVIVKSKYFKDKDESESPTTVKENEQGNHHDSTNSKWMPPNWEQVLENIRKMREKEDAPVDTMGCHKCHDDKEDAKVFLSFHS